MNHKIALFAFGLLLATAHLSLAVVDLGKPARETPYDRFMNPVRQVLGDLQGGTTELRRVQQLLRTGRGFRYSFTDPYTAALPAVTAQIRAGDCKAKSLWLAEQLGDTTIRYVIGKARATSPISHAWLLWHDGRSWWILDPTNTNRPIAAERTPKDEYIPLYSWTKSGVYRHTSTLRQRTMVAGKAKTPRDRTTGTGERR